MSFCYYELAKNVGIQRKVQIEIDRISENSGIGNFTYEQLDKMKFVDCCIDETLRKYPVVPFNFRIANRDYKFADSDLLVPKGARIFFPVLGFHRDPEIYENPMEFKPERFLDSSVGGGRSEGTFSIPLGDGPRICVGMRLGKFTVKIGIVTILSKFNIELTDKAMINEEIEFSPKNFILTPNKPFNFKLVPR